MASTRLSLRAAILCTFLAIGEVSARYDASGAAPRQHRRRGRCSPSHTVSSSSLSVTSDLPTSTSSSTFETIVIPASTSESLSAPGSDTSTVLSESSTSTAEETTSTSSVEEEITPTPTPTPSLEETSTSLEETTRSTEPTTTSESLPAPTSTSESLPTSTSSEPLPSTSEEPTSTSAAFVTSTTPPCEPTVSTWAPELCWRSVPARCSSMTITTLAAPSVTAHINACNAGLRVYDNQLAPEVSGCFENIGQAAFNPTSAYSCISSAPIYCQATSACAPAATAAPIIPPFDNPSFESGTFGSWTEVPPATPGNLVGSISTEQAHSGQYSLKMQFNNIADDFIAWQHKVRFEPGGKYEFSFWYYSLSNQSRGTLSLKVEYPGTSLPLVVQMSTQGPGKWVQQKFSLTPSTSFGTFSVTYLSTKGTVGNTIYIDDVTLTKVG